MVGPKKNFKSKVLRRVSNDGLRLVLSIKCFIREPFY